MSAQAHEEERSYYQMFLEEVRNYLADFDLGIDEFETGHSTEKLNRVLHTIKGNAASAGLTQLSSFIHELEQSMLPYRENMHYSSQFRSDIQKFRDIIELMMYSGKLPDKITENLIHSFRANLKNSQLEDHLSVFEKHKYELKIQLNKDTEFPILEALQLQNIITSKANILYTEPNLAVASKEDKIFHFVFYILYDGEVAQLRSSLQIPHVVTDIEIDKFTAKNLQGKAPAPSDTARAIDENSTKIEQYQLEMMYNSIIEICASYRGIVDDNLPELATFLSSFYHLRGEMQQQTTVFRTTMINYLSKFMSVDRLFTVQTLIRDVEDGFLSLIMQLHGQMFNAISLVESRMHALDDTINKFKHVVTDSQMVPINQLFLRLEDIVKRYCKELKKDVLLKIEGEDVRIDRSLIGELLDPLVHCIRNSLDHGIEDAEERLKVGKKKQGTVHISAKNQGHMIRIECTDDGSGIDPEHVRKRALEQGYIEDGENVSEQALLHLLFRPGFSTTYTPSHISGMGLGLNVVKYAVENLQGRVLIHSETGQRTSITMLIPVNLSMFHCVIVQSKKEKFAIPSFSISEIKIIDKKHSMESKKQLPVFNLGDIAMQNSEKKDSPRYMLISESEGQLFGLSVEDIMSYHEVMVKRMPLVQLPDYILGCSIMPDSSMILILQPSRLVRRGWKMHNIRNGAKGARHAYTK